MSELKEMVRRQTIKKLSTVTETTTDFRMLLGTATKAYEAGQTLTARDQLEKARTLLKAQDRHVEEVLNHLKTLVV